MWTKLDDNFESHPKIMQVGLAGTGLFARALSYCGRQRTDGLVPEAWVKAHTAGEQGGQALAQRLVDARLWERKEGGYFIRDYVAPGMNPSRAEQEETARKKRDAGRKGAAALHGKSHGTSHGNSHADRTTPVLQPEPEPEPKPEVRPGRAAP